MAAAASATPVRQTSRVEWTLVGDTMYVQPDAPADWLPTTAEEVRLVADDGSVVASAAVRLAEPGEPRTCGVPAVPLIASFKISQDVIDQFTPQSTPLLPRQPTYHIEVREGPNWRLVEMIDRRNLAGEGPCYE